MKIKTMIVALAAAMLLAACATTGPQPLTPAQIAAIACPQINLAVTQLTAFNAVAAADPATKAFATKANADLIVAQPTIAAVCAAGATVTATNLQALAQQALPALGTVVGSLPLPPAQQAQVQGALVLAETAMGLAGVVEQQIQAAKAAVPAAK
jgi:predicted small lipoprotein YifL